MKLLETFAKEPQLKNSDWLVVSECLKIVHPKTFEQISKDRIVLSCCPEAEDGPAIYGKLASMIRSNNPNSILVVTIECSPHCYTLQAAVNEALYICTTKPALVSRKVFVDGVLQEISPEAVRVARYLHLVEKLIRQSPGILQDLKKHSLEQQADLK